VFITLEQEKRVVFISLQAAVSGWRSIDTIKEKK
jgi:hypothetical protein